MYRRTPNHVSSHRLMNPVTSGYMAIPLFGSMTVMAEQVLVVSGILCFPPNDRLGFFLVSPVSLRPKALSTK
jgi:hypothetical protein